MNAMNDVLIDDFSNEFFQTSFRKYFAEPEIKVIDWEKLFEEMNEQQGNLAILRTSPERECWLYSIQG